MNIPVALYGLAAFGGVASVAGAQVAPAMGRDSLKTIPVWVEAGAGIGVISPVALVGTSATLGVTVRDDQVIFARYTNLGEFCFIDGCSNPERIAEVAALYGVRAQSRFFGGMLAAGAALFTDFTRNDFDSSRRLRSENLGVPLEMRGSVFPVPWLGVSLTAAGDLNERHCLFQGFVGLQIGHF